MSRGPEGTYLFRVEMRGEGKSRDGAFQEAVRGFTEEPSYLVVVDPDESPWDEHPLYPLEDWKAEVANDDTRLGYLEWCAHKEDD